MPAYGMNAGRAWPDPRLEPTGLVIVVCQTTLRGLAWARDAAAQYLSGRAPERPAPGRGGHDRRPTGPVAAPGHRDQGLHRDLYGLVENTGTLHRGGLAVLVEGPIDAIAVDRPPAGCWPASRRWAPRWPASRCWAPR